MNSADSRTIAGSSQNNPLASGENKRDEEGESDGTDGSFELQTNLVPKPPQFCSHGQPRFFRV